MTAVTWAWVSLLAAVPFAWDHRFGAAIARDVVTPGTGAVTLAGYAFMALLLTASFAATASLACRDRSWFLDRCGALRAPLAVALGVGALARLWLAAGVYGSGNDIGIFQREAEDVLAGRNLFRPEQNVYFYLPGIAYLSAAALATANATGFSYHFMMKFGALAADLLAIVLLFRGARTDPREALRVALLMAVNPLSLATTGMHGQFDAVGAALLLGAVLSAERAPTGSGRSTAVWAAMAIYMKNWPMAFLPPAFLAMDGWSRRIRTALLAAAILVVVSFTFVPGDRMDMIASNSRYPSSFGWWGPSGPFAVAAERVPALWEFLPAGNGDRWRKLPPMTGLLVFYAWTLGWRDRRRQTAAAFLLFASLTVSFAPQHTVWGLPILLALPRCGWTAAFLLGVGAWDVVSEAGFICSHLGEKIFGLELGTMLMRLGGIVPWAIMLGWCVALMRRENNSSGSIVAPPGMAA